MKRNHSNCFSLRQVSLAKRAQNQYETVLSEARAGIPLRKESFYRTEKIISDAVMAGQHLFLCMTDAMISLEDGAAINKMIAQTQKETATAAQA